MTIVPPHRLRGATLKLADHLLRRFRVPADDPVTVIISDGKCEEVDFAFAACLFDSFGDALPLPVIELHGWIFEMLFSVATECGIVVRVRY